MSYENGSAVPEFRQSSVQILDFHSLIDPFRLLSPDFSKAGKTSRFTEVSPMVTSKKHCWAFYRSQEPKRRYTMLPL